jgi:hypothetical protein
MTDIMTSHNIDISSWDILYTDVSENKTVDSKYGRFSEQMDEG